MIDTIHGFYETTSNRDVPRSQTHIVPWGNQKAREARGRMPKQPPKKSQIWGIFNANDSPQNGETTTLHGTLAGDRTGVA
jgi:hypothetical protein